jgi:hypothetical protein
VPTSISALTQSSFPAMNRRDWSAYNVDASAEHERVAYGASFSGCLVRPSLIADNADIFAFRFLSLPSAWMKDYESGNRAASCGQHFANWFSKWPGWWRTTGPKAPDNSYARLIWQMPDDGGSPGPFIISLRVPPRPVWPNGQLPLGKIYLGNACFAFSTSVSLTIRELFGK